MRKCNQLKTLDSRCTEQAAAVDNVGNRYCFKHLGEVLKLHKDLGHAMKTKSLSKIFEEIKL